MRKLKEYYQELLNGFAASGKNVSEFCMDNGISKNTFYYAKDRMELEKPKEEKEQNQPKEQKEFVKVTVTEDFVTAYIGESGTKIRMDPDGLAEIMKRERFNFLKSQKLMLSMA